METVFQTARDKMGKSISSLKGEYAAIRANRATAAVLDKITVDYYGTATPINQLAAISVVEARILCIQPWDVSTLHPIEKAIQTSDLGKVIRLTFPPLTEDKRREIVKDVKKLAEDCKVAIRSIRRDCMDKLKKMQKNGEITEDDLKYGEKEMQDITDKFVKETDSVAAEKEKEIMAI